MKEEVLKEREKWRKEVLESIGGHDAFQGEEEEDIRRPPTRTIINVDSWVGTIHCVLHVWRWHNRTNSPECVSQDVVLPRPEDGQRANTRQFALWKRDMFPKALHGERQFVPDSTELRNRLEEGRKKYAFQSFSRWRNMYLTRKHG